MSNSSKIIVIAIIALVVGAVLGYYIGFDNGSNKSANNIQTPAPTPTPNPDPTPVPNPPANNYDPAWQISTDSASGVTFKYPASLGTRYISLVDWPPKVQVLQEAFICTAAGNPTDRAGKTEKRKVGARDYCVTTVSEGAAGSIYNQYAYAFAKDNKTVILTFSTRLPQCVNYDNPEQGECEAERAAFKLDDVVDRIAQTLTLAK